MVLKSEPAPPLPSTPKSLADEVGATRESRDERGGTPASLFGDNV